MQSAISCWSVNNKLFWLDTDSDKQLGVIIKSWWSTINTSKSNNKQKLEVSNNYYQ